MMKSILILATAALVASQDGGYFPGQPACAIPCLTSAIPKAGCALSDVACQCGPTQSAIANNLAPCILGSCSGDDVQQALTAGQAVCSSFSAGELTIPSTAAATSTSAVSTTASSTMTSTPSEAASGSSVATSTSAASSLNATSASGATKTLTEPVASSTRVTSVTATPTGNGAAKVAGGLLAGVLAVAVAL